MTHRVFSRNARSSRAVPVKNLLTEVIYVPHFMKNQPGMQSFEEFDENILIGLQEDWITFAQATQDFSNYLAEKGVHKQWANRPLEWFGYIDTLVTSTEWINFFKLRDHKDAMPEIRFLAQAMWKEFQRVMDTGEYQILTQGQYHLPYVTNYMTPQEMSDFTLQDLLKLSVARCARVSYAPFDGNPSIEKETQRYNLLLNANPFHASPFEHQANVFNPARNSENIYMKYIPGENAPVYKSSNFEYPWLQYRKTIEHKLPL